MTYRGNIILLPVHILEDTGRIGNITIGPLPERSLSRIFSEFQKHGLYVTAEDHVAPEVNRTLCESRKPFLVMKGRGVSGYIVDRDGVEATLADIATCFSSILDLNEEVSVTGAHKHPQGSVVTTRVVVSLTENGPQADHSQDVKRGPDVKGIEP